MDPQYYIKIVRGFHPSKFLIIPGSSLWGLVVVLKLIPPGAAGRTLISGVPVGPLPVQTVKEKLSEFARLNLKHVNNALSSNWLTTFFQHM